MWQLNLAMSEDEAVQIVDLYDTTGKGEMRYEQLVKDVCAGVPHFTKQYDDPETIAKLRKQDRAEPTTRGKAHDDERMMQFMFTNRPLEKVPCQLAEEFKVRLKTVLTQSLFELQVRLDGVKAMPRRLDAVDVAVRESTCLAREPRQFRDGLNQHRSRCA